MALENAEEESYLTELYNQTQGKIEHQVSMYDVGTALGLEETVSGEIAQSLIIQGVAELKTLSGGIGITIEGLKALNIDILENSNNHAYQLENTRVLTQEGIHTINMILDKIKAVIPPSGLSYEQMEECFVDIKTIEIQLLSKSPKTAIIIEIIRSLYENLSSMDKDIHHPDDVINTLNSLLSDSN